MSNPISCVAILGSTIDSFNQTIGPWLLNKERPLHLLFEWHLVREQRDSFVQVLSSLGQGVPDELLHPEAAEMVEVLQLDLSETLSIVLLPGRGLSTPPPLIAAIQHAVRNHCPSLSLLIDERALYCADPTQVKEAIRVEEIAYDEAAEIYAFGKGSLERQALRYASTADIILDVYDLADLAAAPTRICENPKSDSFGVRALVSRRGMGLLNISKAESHPGTPSFAELLLALEHRDIYPEFISRSVADETCTLAIDGELVPEARLALASYSDSWQVQIPGTAFSTIGIVGSHMRHRAGVSGKIFETLGKNGVSVAAIAQSTSERAISVLIEDHDTQKALISLHDSLFLSARNRLHLLLVGPGSIGSELLAQIEQHASSPEKSRTTISLVGITNRRNSLVNPSGISTADWQRHLGGEEQRIPLQDALSAFAEINLPNSIVIDCTASDELPQHYPTLLAQSISVVTPNKRGLCGPIEEYRQRHAIARRHNAKWYYETTVGAGLPIIGTIHDLLGSGDTILKIEAILSGTLSYLWNTYDTTRSFADLVRQAQAQGITEPDPRDDLNGADVARKLLILAREAGQQLDLEDVQVIPPVPAHCLETNSVEDFYAALEAAETAIAGNFRSASEVGKRLRYIASIEEGDARVSLQSVTREHPAYQLEGTDNILSITTKRYHTQPLVVRGPGAGVSVTAAGVFADILRVASYLE